MRTTIFAAVALLAIASSSCNKQENQIDPRPQHEASEVSISFINEEAPTRTFFDPISAADG